MESLYQLYGRQASIMQESVGMKTLELVFFDAGGGHRSAANALCEVVRRQDRPWEMRMMNLQELLDEMDVFRKITGIRLQDSIT